MEARQLKMLLLLPWVGRELDRLSRSMDKSWEPVSAQKRGGTVGTATDRDDPRGRVSNFWTLEEADFGSGIGVIGLDLSRCGFTSDIETWV